MPGRCGRERIVAEQSHDKSGVALGTPARHDLAFRKRLNLPRNVQNSSHEASKFTPTPYKSQDFAGEIGTGIWAGKGLNIRTDQQGNDPQNYTTFPAKSWDLHLVASIHGVQNIFVSSSLTPPRGEQDLKSKVPFDR